MADEQPSKFNVMHVHCPHGTSAKPARVAVRCILHSSRQRLMQLSPLLIPTPLKSSLLARTPDCMPRPHLVLVLAAAAAAAVYTWL